MKAKNIVLAIFASLILLLGNSMHVYGSRNIAPVVSAEGSSTPSPTVTPYPASVPVSARAIQKFARSEILSASAHGLPMSATNFRIDKNMIKVDVCYQYPDNRDWIIPYALIQTQSHQIPLLEGRGIELTETLSNGQKKVTAFPSPNSGIHQPTWQTIKSDGLPDYRCDTLSFLLDSDLSFPSHVKLVIKQIYGFPDKSKGCYGYREGVQHILEAKGSGIKIDCTKSDDKFGNGSRSIVVKKPNSMKPEEADSEVYRAYQEYYTFTGPWVFEGEVKNTANP